MICSGNLGLLSDVNRSGFYRVAIMTIEDNHTERLRAPYRTVSRNAESGAIGANQRIFEKVISKSRYPS